MRFFLVIFSILLWSIPTMAQDQNYKTEIANAEKLGSIIQSLDLGAWVATDQMLAEYSSIKSLPNLRGYISLKDGKYVRTGFVTDNGGGPKVAYDVKSKKRKIKSAKKVSPPRDLTPEELRRWAARATVLKEKHDSCREFLPMNMIIFPVPDDPKNQLYAYLFSATQKHNEIVFGKHYRFLISSNGHSLLERHSFANSCIGISPPSEVTQKEYTSVGAVISHVKAPYPEEHHVFANLSHDQDIYVTIPETGTLWKIHKGKITKVRNKK